jgi:hypothetical protein
MKPSNAIIVICGLEYYHLPMVPLCPPAIPRSIRALHLHFSLSPMVPSYLRPPVVVVQASSSAKGLV